MTEMIIEEGRYASAMTKRSEKRYVAVKDIVRRSAKFVTVTLDSLGAKDFY
jgi:hypothetical protein